jgi:hypothetical protein
VTESDHLARVLSRHYFIDRDTYFESCYCYCGLEFQPREAPTDWARHCAEVVSDVLKSRSLRAEPM